MQLFVCDFDRKDATVVIDDKRVVRQCFTVLRMKEGDVFSLQSVDGDLRHEITIETISSTAIQGVIHNTQSRSSSSDTSVSLLVAFPNTRKKLHLLAQKLTEVGVSELVFCRMDRSQMKEISEKKVAKLEAIVLEAVEQSKSWSVPEVKVVDDFELVKKYETVVVFDLERKDSLPSFEPVEKGQTVLGIVGPEGGLTDVDYDNILMMAPDVAYCSLGKTVLRMETAAIVGGWLLVNS